MDGEGGIKWWNESSIDKNCSQVHPGAIKERVRLCIFMYSIVSLNRDGYPLAAKLVFPRAFSSFSEKELESYLSMPCGDMSFLLLVFPFMHDPFFYWELLA